MRHTGICRVVKTFGERSVAEVARKLEHDYGDRFRPFGATLAVRPIRISHVLSVGDGLQLALDPDDLSAWEHWGFFESDIEYRVRRRFASRWKRVKNDADLRAWMESESVKYLNTLAKRTAPPAVQ